MMIDLLIIIISKTQNYHFSKFNTITAGPKLFPTLISIYKEVATTICSKFCPRTSRFSRSCFNESITSLRSWYDVTIENINYRACFYWLMSNGWKKSPIKKMFNAFCAPPVIWEENRNWTFEIWKTLHFFKMFLGTSAASMNSLFL